jgi:hypothetical protein
MHDLLVAVLVIAGFLLILGLVALIQHRLHPHGYDASAQQIQAELQAILDGQPYAIDDFLSVPLRDPRFEAMRQRVFDLPKEFPPSSRKDFCSSQGMEIIRGFVEELERQPT